MAVITVTENRPDEQEPPDRTALPFAIAAAVIAALGSAYVWRRYGSRWGAPASVLAAYTGISRVVGQNHFVDDVISGAAIGLLSNLLWTDPIDERVRMTLAPTHGGAEVMLSIDPSARTSTRFASSNEA